MIDLLSDEMRRDPFPALRALIGRRRPGGAVTAVTARRR